MTETNTSRSNTVTRYKEEMVKVDEVSRPEYDEAYRKTVLEPLTNFSLFFPEINEIITKRSHKLLDYDAAKSKVKKLVESPSEDSKKLAEVTDRCC